MKKNYSAMEAVVIPISNNLEASGESCIIITQLEDSSGDLSARCDITPDEYIQREWFGNNEGLSVTSSLENCY